MRNQLKNNLTEYLKIKKYVNSVLSRDSAGIIMSYIKDPRDVWAKNNKRYTFIRWEIERVKKNPLPMFKSSTDHLEDCCAIYEQIYFKRIINFMITKKNDNGCRSCLMNYLARIGCIMCGSKKKSHRRTHNTICFDCYIKGIKPYNDYYEDEERRKTYKVNKFGFKGLIYYIPTQNIERIYYFENNNCVGITDRNNYYYFSGHIQIYDNTFKVKDEYTNRIHTFNISDIGKRIDIYN